MGRKDNHSRMQARRITPVSGMREFLGDSTFRLVMLVSLLFAFLHYRVINSELQSGEGGLWCSLGIPALLCLAISVVLAFFGAKVRILPALLPIIGLGGIGASMVMFFIIVLGRMRFSVGLLGTLQEISMLLFIAAWGVCVVLLIMTGIGLRVAQAAGIPAALASIIALALFVIRVMYIFSSLVTALSRNLLLPDGEMASEIQWVLRSVQPGEENARAIYFDRLLDSVAIALLLMCCSTLAFKFNGFFSEQAVMMNNAKEIPPPSRRQTVYDGYDEYTADVSVRNEEDEEYTITSEGYYVEKKKTDRPKFKRRERSETSGEGEIITDAGLPEESYEIEDTEPDRRYEFGEYYDDYIPGEGWGTFLQRTVQPVQEPAADAAAEPKRVKPVQTDRPIIDPKDPDFWNQYKN